MSCGNIFGFCLWSTHSHTHTQSAPSNLGSSGSALVRVRRRTFLFMAYLLNKYWMLCISIINLIFRDEKQNVFVCIYYIWKFGGCESERERDRERWYNSTAQTICWFIYNVYHYKVWSMQKSNSTTRHFDLNQTKKFHIFRMLHEKNKMDFLWWNIAIIILRVCKWRIVFDCL